MVKAYNRYEATTSFGVITTGESRISYDSTGIFLFSASLEKVAIWKVRTGDSIKTLIPTSSSFGPSLAVTSIVTSPSSLVASGYADGSVRIWDYDRGTCESTLNGHKGSVSALRYSISGSLLASGSKDSDIILWDVVVETGLFRLRGHRDQVTDLVFLHSDKKLVSSSKDKFLRVWDLETQHCMQIITGHNSEIWSVDIDFEERYLVTGSADPELRCYTIKCNSVGFQDVPNAKEAEIFKSGDTDIHNKWEVLKLFGEIHRQTKHRVATVRFNRLGNLLACQVAGKTVEVFRVLDKAESRHKAKRRLNRKKGKKSKKVELTENGDANHEANEESNFPIVTVPDIFKLLQIVRSKSKVCSISFCPITSKSSLATLALSLSDNSLQVYSIESDSTTRTHSIELLGHRSSIRSVTLSSDNSLLMTTSHNAVKIWNPSLCICLCTVESDFGLCSLFGPNNKFAFIGTKSGKIEIIDIRSHTSINSQDQEVHHTKNVESMALIPGGYGFVTGSLDHMIMFWEFQKQKPSQTLVNQLISCVRTRNMENGVLSVCVSPDAKYVAAALLDSTVKVLFMDSLKIFLSLYGHNLPVLCTDISSDGDLIVTGSLDKNLRIWGMDFGDCHKSIFAHADSVKAVKFVGNTHYVFSVGNDRLVKYWDVDKFELLLTLEGHHAQVSSLAVSTRGDFIVTGSDDISIRRWDRTEEPFFIEEEKEKRLEEMFEADLDSLFENKYAPKEEIPDEGSVAVVGKKTQETLTATDTIIDALDMAESELKRISEHKEVIRGKGSGFQPNIFMQGLSPSEHVLHAVSNVRTNDLEQTLLALPFSDALNLISYLKEWTLNRDKIELVCRISAVLLQVHHNQLVSTPAAKPVLIVLKDILHAKVKECKDNVGFNLAAMDHLKQLMAMRSDTLFKDVKTKLNEIRTRLSKRAETQSCLKEERRRKKKKSKNTNELHAHAWMHVQS